MILLRPRGGIGNRVGVISAAVPMAKEYNQKLIILWDINPNLFAPYNDMLLPIKGVKVIQRRFSQQKIFEKIDIWKFKLSFKLFPYLTSVFYYQTRDESVGKPPLDRALIKNASKKAFIYIDICSPELIYDQQDYSIIQLSNKYNNCVEAIMTQCGGYQKYIGVHIRRGTVKMNISAIFSQKSPLEAFITRMKEIEKQEPTIMFYLATDDPDIEKIMEQSFKNKILYNKERVMNTDSREGQRDAIIDLKVLEGAKMVLGTYSSWFSTFPLMHKNVPTEIINVDKE